MPQKRLPCGFTLVELLVVIAIIGVLVALLLAGGAIRPRSRPPGKLQQQAQAKHPRLPQLRIGL